MKDRSLKIPAARTDVNSFPELEMDFLPVHGLGWCRRFVDGGLGGVVDLVQHWRLLVDVNWRMSSVDYVWSLLRCVV